MKVTERWRVEDRREIEEKREKEAMTWTVTLWLNKKEFVCSCHWLSVCILSALLVSLHCFSLSLSHLSFFSFREIEGEREREREREIWMKTDVTNLGTSSSRYFIIQYLLSWIFFLSPSFFFLPFSLLFSLLSYIANLASRKNSSRTFVRVNIVLHH